jgi:hypothetical protein
MIDWIDYNYKQIVSATAHIVSKTSNKSKHVWIVATVWTDVFDMNKY